MTIRTRKASYQNVKDALHGRSCEVVSWLGLSASITDGRHHPCPRCGAAKLRISKPDELIGGCDACKITWTNPIDFAAIVLNVEANEARERLASQFGIGGSVDAGSISGTRPTNAKPKPHLPPEAIGPDGLSIPPQVFTPATLTPKIASLFCSTRPGVSHRSLTRSGAVYGTWKQRKAISQQNVVGVPVYGRDLSIVNYQIFSPTGNGIEIRSKDETGTWITAREKKWLAFGQSQEHRDSGAPFDRNGVFLTESARQMLIDSKPIDGLISIRVEGCSDFLALIEIVPNDQPAIVYSNSDGARSAAAAEWLIPMIERLQPIDHYVIGDCDDAGLLGSLKWASCINDLANVTPKVVKLPFEHVSKKGKDLRDYLATGEGWDGFLSLLKASSEFNADEVVLIIESLKRNQTENDDEQPNDSDLERESTQKQNKTPKSSTIQNFEKYEKKNSDGTTEECERPLPIITIAESVFEQTGGFPKRFGDTLGVINSKNEVREIGTSTKLFAYLRERTQVNVKPAPHFATREEIFETVKNMAQHYPGGVEQHPHFPRLDGTFYLCDDPTPTDGSCMKEFLAFFKPETEHIDRELMKAALVTTFWGGPCGARPAFLFGSTSGQGVGKTTAASMIAKVSGGSIDFDQQCDREATNRRLLNGDVKSRVLLFDNIKAASYSNASLESLITSKNVSGHRMYVGNSSRPNNFTVFLTLNAPMFSRDMAQRLVMISLADAVRSPKWESTVNQFIEKNRETLISDIAGFFTRPTKALSTYNRWGTWQGEVLSRLDDPEPIVEELSIRESKSDGDRLVADDLTDHMVEFVKDFGYKMPYRIHVTLKTLARIHAAATGEVLTPRSVASLADRLIHSRLLTQFRRNPSNKYGKGFIFSSIDEQGSGAEISVDLDERIEIRNQEEQESRERRITKIRTHAQREARDSSIEGRNDGF